jgi:hypothetical protein
MKDRRHGEAWEVQDQEEYDNEPKKGRTTNMKDQDNNVGRKKQHH